MWIYISMDGWMDDGWIDVCVYVRMDEWINGWMDGWVDGWIISVCVGSPAWASHHHRHVIVSCTFASTSSLRTRPGCKAFSFPLPFALSFIDLSVRHVHS
jgi:hypothetical protein